MRARCDLCGHKRECKIDSDGDRICLGCEREMKAFHIWDYLAIKGGPLPAGVSVMTPEQQEEYGTGRGLLIRR